MNIHTQLQKSLKRFTYGTILAGTLIILPCGIGTNVEAKSADAADSLPVVSGTAVDVDTDSWEELTAQPDEVSDSGIESEEACTPGSISIAAANKDKDNSAIKLNLKKKSLVKEDSYTLRIYNTNKDQRIKVSSSSRNVVTINKESQTEYVVIGESVGECTITVTVKEGFNTTAATLKCKITVTPPAVAIKFTDNTYYVKVDDKLSLDTELKPSTTAEKPIYESRNKDVATISSSGVVTGQSVGVTYIYASIANGKSDRCKIVVTE